MIFSLLAKQPAASADMPDLDVLIMIERRRIAAAIRECIWPAEIDPRQQMLTGMTRPRYQ